MFRIQNKISLHSYSIIEFIFNCLFIILKGKAFYSSFYVQNKLVQCMYVCMYVQQACYLCQFGFLNNLNWPLTLL